MKKVLALALALVLTLGLVVSAQATDAAPKTIYVIVKVLGNQYWSIVEAGARQAGEDLGCNVVIIGTAAESEVERQVTLLQDAVSSQADGIVIAPLDRLALINPIAEQFKSGIPLILIDSSVDSEDYSAALLTDNIQAGKLAAEALIANLKELNTPEDQEGFIAITIGSAGSQAIIDRNVGFKEYWDANAPEAWKVLWDEVKVNDGDAAKATTFGQDFMTAYPNLIALFAPNNGSTVGFVKALEEAKRTDIAMVGFDFSTEMEEIVRNPDYKVSTVLQRQYFMGYDGVALALELANGGTVTEKVIDTGVMVVNAENVDSDAVKAVVGQ